MENRLYENPKTGIYEDAELLVHNTGNPVHNISVDVLTFIQLQRIGEKVYIPITDYYVVSYRHDNPQGLLKTFKAPGRNKIFGGLHFSSLKEDVEKKYGTFFINIVSITKIKYQDRRGIENEVFFWNRDNVEKQAVEPLLQISKDIFPVDVTKLSIPELIKREAEIREYMRLHKK